MKRASMDRDQWTTISGLRELARLTKCSYIYIVYAFTNLLLFDASMELIRLLTGVAGDVIDLSE